MRNFTLKELVIVVFVTILSATFVSTAATKRSKEAELAQCAFNLKKLGATIFSYTNDNKGFLPETSYLKDNWKMRIMPYLLGKDAKDVKKAIPYFTCPSDNNKLPSFMKTNPNYIGKNSYCGNAYVIDIENVDIDNDHAKGYEPKKISSTDLIILLAEDHTNKNTIGLGPSIRFDRKGDFLYPIEAQKGYHDNKNNYLMLDGGVEYKTYQHTVNPFFNKWIVRFEYRPF
jgi:prepilin-type processing-associated H-X9-DG protein